MPGPILGPKSHQRSARGVYLPLEGGEPINTWVSIYQINTNKIYPAGGRTKTDVRAVLLDGRGRHLWGRPLRGGDLRRRRHGDGWFQAEETAGVKAWRRELSR